MRSMLSRRQLQGFVGRIRDKPDTLDADLDFEKLRIKPYIFIITGHQEPPTRSQPKILHHFRGALNSMNNVKGFKSIIGFRKFLAGPQIPSARIPFRRMSQPIQRHFAREEILGDSKLQF